MSFKYDIHVHTSEVSRCGQSQAADQVRAYIDAGYDGIMITDHYYADWFDDVEGSWDEKIDRYLEGYKNAVRTAKTIKDDFDVLLGIEIRFLENGNDYLVFGVTEEFLRKNREMYRLGIREFKKLTEKNGLLVMQAHPFREWCIVQPAEFLDGIETENAHEGHNNNNYKAREYADLNHLRKIGGGDCHDCAQAGKAGIIVGRRLRSSEELRDILAEDDYKVISVTND